MEKNYMDTETTIYFVRHAQSAPSHDVTEAHWPLSETGQKQAENLAALLHTLSIDKVISSPYTRCLETVRPFLARTDIPLDTHDELRERLLAKGLVDYAPIWQKSWEDFHFCLPECESSHMAQSRFVRAMNEVADGHPGSTIAVSSHGNVIALFLHHIDPSFTRQDAEQIFNPDVVRVRAHNGKFAWDKDFRLAGLHDFATHHRETKYPQKPE